MQWYWFGNKSVFPKLLYTKFFKNRSKIVLSDQNCSTNPMYVVDNIYSLVCVVEMKSTNKKTVLHPE